MFNFAYYYFLLCFSIVFKMTSYSSSVGAVNVFIFFLQYELSSILNPNLLVLIDRCDTEHPPTVSLVCFISAYLICHNYVTLLISIF